jgi:2-polyprenyl-3-methyl-5-hydroxy-6-metoxy-1,4-benzoquinol methylase
MNLASLKAMIHDRLHREEVYAAAAYWDGKAEASPDDAPAMWPHRHYNEVYHADQLALFDALLPDVEGKTVLDLGCGTGRIARHLAGRGARVHGIDFAPQMIARARRLSPESNPSFAVGSIDEVDGEGLYDVTIVLGVLTIACKDRPELLAALRRIRRAIKPRGILLLTEPIHRGFLHRVLRMSLREFRGALDEAGFRVVATHQLHFWPFRFLLAYFPWPRWFTRLGYRAGQGIIALCGNTAWGDYKVIYAVRT